MASLGYTRTGGSPAVGGNKGRAGSSIGRVIDVILDSFHPEYDNFGKSQALNGVFYKLLSDSKEQTEETQYKFAYCNNQNILRVPLPGELVTIVSRPTEERSGTPTRFKTMWGEIVKVWNHPHHNAYPDDSATDGENDFGENFEELDTIAPMQTFPGDDIIEGRHGQSIRFNGTKYDSNTITDDSNNGMPITLISNGQKEPPNPIDPVVEDINEDPSSIYMTSDHTIELIQAHEKRDAFEEEPEKADAYKGSQVIINGGRLYFNAKEEGAFISSTEMIGLNSKVVGIDADDYIGLDAKKIYLGTGAFEESEPALKGETSTVWLDDLVSLLEGLANTMATTPPAPPSYIGALVKEGVKLKAQLPQLKTLLSKLHSKKVFIDKK